MIDIAAGIWQQTLTQLRDCGQERRECVVFWLGPAATPALVDLVIHPVHFATAGYFELDQQWLNRFWVELASRSRSVRVQVHTHEGAAFHSYIDDEGAVVQVPGFLSLVLPGFARADACLERAFLAQLDLTGQFIRAPIESTLRFRDERT